jgi:hypothetical protein
VPIVVGAFVERGAFVDRLAGAFVEPLAGAFAERLGTARGVEVLFRATVLRGTISAAAEGIHAFDNSTELR